MKRHAPGQAGAFKCIQVCFDRLEIRGEREHGAGVRQAIALDRTYTCWTRAVAALFIHQSKSLGRTSLMLGHSISLVSSTMPCISEHNCWVYILRDANSDSDKPETQPGTELSELSNGTGRSKSMQSAGGFSRERRIQSGGMCISSWKAKRVPE